MLSSKATYNCYTCQRSGATRDTSGTHHHIGVSQWFLSHQSHVSYPLRHHHHYPH